MTWITVQNITRQALRAQKRKEAVWDASCEQQLPDGQWQVKLDYGTVSWLLEHAFPGETIEDTILRLIGAQQH